MERNLFYSRVRQILQKHIYVYIKRERYFGHCSAQSTIVHAFLIDMCEIPEIQKIREIHVTIVAQ